MHHRSSARSARRPLTLIVGRNGSGKTTIIEALRYATTGDLPPHTKPQSFVHDPRVARQDTVYGCVKLRATAASGRPFLVTRNFQLQQQRNKSASFKTNESSIKSVDAQGNTSNVSKKCSDINSEVPMLLGVSKAILDNVIFVHQEDASWPLGDPKSVKERFDDIFAATKYTKALEEIRKQKTDMNYQIKNLHEELKAVKEKKARAEECRNNERQYRERVEQFQREVEALEAEISDAESREAAAEEALERANKRANEVASIKEKRAVVSDELSQKQRSIENNFGTRIDATDDQLKEKLQTLESNLSNMRQEVREAESSYNDAKAKADTATKEHENAKEQRINSEAIVEARKEQQERFIQSAQEHARIHLPQQMYNSLPELNTVEAVSKVRDALTSRAQELENELEETRKSWDQQVQSKGRELQNVQQEEMRLDAAKSQKQEELKAAQQSVTQTTKELEDQPQMNNSAIHLKRQEAEQLRAQAQEAENQLSGDRKEELQKLKDEYEKAQKKSQALTDEYRTMAKRSEAAAAARAKHAEAEAKRDDANQRVRQRQKDVESLIEEAEGALEVTRPPNAKAEDPRDAVDMATSLSNTVKIVADARAGEAEEARRKAMEADAEAKQASRAAEHEENEEAKLRENIEVTSQASGQSADDVAARQQELESDLESWIRAEEKHKTIVLLSNEFVQTAEEQHRCIWCGVADFAEGDEMKTKSEVSEWKEKSQKRMQEASNRIQSLREQRKQFGEAAHISERWHSKRDHDLPQAKQHAYEKHHAAHQFLESKREAEKAEERAKDIYERIYDLKSQFEQAWNIMKEAEEQESMAKSEEPASIGGSESRTLEQVEQEWREADEQKRDAERSRERAQESLGEKQEELSKLSSEAKKEEDKLKQMCLQVKEKEELQKRLDEEQTSLETLKQKVTQLEDELRPKQKAREEIQQALDGLKSQQEQQLYELDSSARKVRSASEQLDTQCSSAGVQDMESNLDMARKSEESARREKDSKEEAAQAQYIKWSEASKKVEDKDTANRHVKECLNLRETEHKAQELDRRQAELENEIEQESDVCRAKQLVDKERSTLASKREERSKSQGIANESEKMREKEEQKLRSPDLSGVDELYARKQVEHRTAELAVEDLQQWHNKLDTALQKFHKRKMSEVNKVLRELWQKTYTGADIDRIEVKSEPAKQTGSGRSRSYDYRVVMHCGGVELDMRGRCSAGQRVLACIILRLALAETFCLSCGVLALDEPSASLDEVNASSLAESLQGIMDSRHGQANFQLVVITHERRFAEALGQNRHADYYWRISKNSSGNSEIEREELLSTRR
jgi:DNA repair protein RAD50